LQVVIVYAKDDEAILIDQDSDADRAIAILATLGGSMPGAADRCNFVSGGHADGRLGAAGGLGADSLLVTWPVSCTSC
jgi:hypothetical protein